MTRARLRVVEGGDDNRDQRPADDRQLVQAARRGDEDAFTALVERYASGPLTLDSVKAFYSQTLPQLGWQAKPDKRANHLAFEREGESLDIEFKKVDSELVVRFSVAPG